MDNFAVIGGSGFYELEELADARRYDVETAFGAPTTALLEGTLGGKRCVFLPRHGPGHKIPPHKINYRANIRALYEAGVEHIFSVNAVGGIHPEAVPGSLVVPDQLIDYTYGREHTFADTLTEHINHIDFTWPFSEPLRQQLIRALDTCGSPRLDKGVYGCSQGPRLETAAEIRRMQADGCDLVGMTAMPEAALARELGMGYASLCIVVNRAAGLEDAPISMQEIQAVLDQSVARVRDVLLCALRGC
jgi:5'-methylthioinosine phosphorylase